MGLEIGAGNFNGMTGAQGLPAPAQAPDPAATARNAAAQSAEAGGRQGAARDAWARIQAQYGKQPEKQREVKKQLDKDDFLKIMITQMQHQDPTKPFEADKMAQEIAQITSFEALSNVGHALDKLAVQNRPLERLAMTQLIGKDITIDKNRFSHEAGKASTLSFNLPENAQEVKITLISEKGEVILEKDLGPRDAGEATFTWDGKQKNTIQASNGIYLMKVDAKTSGGQSIQSNTTGRARVVGVSFQGTTPVFLVGDAQNQTRIPMDSVVQIDDAEPAAPGAPGAPAKGAGNAFFTFQKGVGSQALPGGLQQPPQAQQAQPQPPQQMAPQMPSQMPSQAQAPVQAAPPQVAAQERGFPNGMGIYGSQNQQTERGGEGE